MQQHNVPLQRPTGTEGFSAAQAARALSEKALALGPRGLEEAYLLLKAELEDTQAPEIMAGRQLRPDELAAAAEAAAAAAAAEAKAAEAKLKAKQRMEEKRAGSRGRKDQLGQSTGGDDYQPFYTPAAAGREPPPHTAPGKEGGGEAPQPPTAAALDAVAAKILASWPPTAKGRRLGGGARDGRQAKESNATRQDSGRSVTRK